MAIVAISLLLNRITNCVAGRGGAITRGGGGKLY